MSRDEDGATARQPLTGCNDRSQRPLGQGGIQVMEIDGHHAKFVVHMALHPPRTFCGPAQRCGTIFDLVEDGPNGVHIITHETIMPAGCDHPLKTSINRSDLWC